MRFFLAQIGFCNEKKTVHITPLFGNQISNLPGRFFVSKMSDPWIYVDICTHMHYMFLELHKEYTVEAKK